jgi:translation initiation factor 2 beta subunit (eIF-2beta)/eIF-5
MRFHSLSKHRVPLLALIAVILVAPLLLATVLSYFISSETLRAYLERQMDSRLKEYTVRVGRAYFHPLSFSLDLDELLLIQNSHPFPPVAHLKRIHASVHWYDLWRGKLVASFRFEHPAIHIDVNNINEERKSKIPFGKKGWQDAIQSIYPLKINLLTIQDGEITYVNVKPYKPLYAHAINLTAKNIRNTLRAFQAYPSPVQGEGVIFDSGTFAVDGRANFLQQPFAGFQGRFTLANIDLIYFNPLLIDKNLVVRKDGFLYVKGTLENAPRKTNLDIEEILVKEIGIDYLNLPERIVAEREKVKRAMKEVNGLRNKTETKIRVRKAEISDATIGYEDKTIQPSVRFSLEHANLSLRNVSNQYADGAGSFRLDGKFMGQSGIAVHGDYWLEKNRLKGEIDLQHILVSYFLPYLAKERNLRIRSGALSLAGNVDYAPRSSHFEVKQADIDDLNVDYLHLPETLQREKERAARVEKSAKNLTNNAEKTFKIDSANIRGARFAYEDRTAKPGFRFYIDQTNISLKNVSNQFADGPGDFGLDGKFMGEARVAIHGDYWMEKKRLISGISLERVSLAYFTPFLEKEQNFRVRSGVVSVAGKVDYSPHDSDLDIEQAEIDELKIDYVHRRETAKKEKEKVGKALKSSESLINNSTKKIKIESAKVKDACFVYEDKEARPNFRLSLDQTNISLKNISNQFVDGPASIQLDGKFMGSGSVDLEGSYLLEKSRLASKFALKEISLLPLTPFLARDPNLKVRKGIVSASGSLDYSARKSDLVVDRANIQGLRVDYVHLRSTAAKEKEKFRKVTRSVQRESNRSDQKFKIDLVKLEDCFFAYADRTTNPPYELFLSRAHGQLINLSNQRAEGLSHLDLQGQFMGTGNTDIQGTFLSETNRPDIDLRIAIERTQMAAMSDLFKAYGKFDVKSGLFSFYSEMKIRGTEMDGYVKPFLKDMEVYEKDPAKRSDLGHWIYLKAVSGVSKALKNSHREVATKTRISGSLSNAKVDTMQAIGNLIRNALLEAITPGFEERERNRRAVSSGR